MQVLERKADVLSRVFSKLNQNQLFFQSLSTLIESDNKISREFAMYGFEIMTELSLSGEELAAAKNDFFQIFEKTLVDTEVTVRIASLKAITAFVSGLEDYDTV